MKLYKNTIKLGALYCIFYSALHLFRFLYYYTDTFSSWGDWVFDLLLDLDILFIGFGAFGFGFNLPPLYLLLTVGLFSINLYVLKRKNELTLKRFACLLFISIFILLIGVRNHDEFSVMVESGKKFWEYFPFIPGPKYD
ncbi:hypothetical protein [Filifactor villosus]|uniref:LTA synthase family protein n=1 Tax=Filifactor villosus TaxID=29374 RepID=A0ABV9QQA6_9FIRM